MFKSVDNESKYDDYNNNNMTISKIIHDTSKSNEKYEESILNNIMSNDEMFKNRCYSTDQASNADSMSFDTYSLASSELSYKMNDFDDYDDDDDYDDNNADIISLENHDISDTVNNNDGVQNESNTINNKNARCLNLLQRFEDNKAVLSNISNRSTPVKAMHNLNLSIQPSDFEFVRPVLNSDTSSVLPSPKRRNSFTCNQSSSAKKVRRSSSSRELNLPSSLIKPDPDAFVANKSFTPKSTPSTTRRLNLKHPPSTPQRISPKALTDEYVSVFSALSSQNRNILSRMCLNSKSTLNDRKTKASLDDFEIFELLGTGCFGDVYRVRDKRNDEIYALKVSKKVVSNKTLEKSGSILKRLDLIGSDPNGYNHFIVRYIEEWCELSQLYTLMEYCEKGTLDDFVKKYVATDELYKNMFKEETIWKLLYEMSKALQGIHQYKVIHLDVKPDNIFLKNDNTFKLGDFGIALLQQDANTADCNDGDARYMAPELFKEQIQLTEAVDIFSLGAVLFELITKFELDSNGPTFHLLRSGANLFTKCESHIIQTSSDLQNLIQKMMKPNPDDRPTAFEIRIIAQNHLQFYRDTITPFESLRISV